MTAGIEELIRIINDSREGKHFELTSLTVMLLTEGKPDGVFSSSVPFRYIIECLLDGFEGAWVNVLSERHLDEGYQELLALTPFGGKQLLFATHTSVGLSLEGFEFLMWDDEGHLRTPERVKAQFGNDALGWLEAWVYEAS